VPPHQETAPKPGVGTRHNEKRTGRLHGVYGERRNASL